MSQPTPSLTSRPVATDPPRGAPAAAPPRGTRFLPAGEAVLFDSRPHPLFIALRSVGAIGLLLALAVLLAWAAGRFALPLPRGLWGWALLAALLRLGWDLLEWLARRYILTDGHVLRFGGVITRYATESSLERIQHVTLTQRLRERIFGLGTIGFATAGTGTTEMYWVMVDRPHERLRMVREAIERRKAGATPAAASGAAGPPVIGLAGGIGAGKSEVASLLAEHGCIVVDSDREAKAMLDRHEVREQLVRWWGPRVLLENGAVDRSAVANIVFADPAERARLEGLVHPLVKAERQVVRARAAAAGAPAVVVDAPLLFEAGVDAECDAVIFVDAPREERLRRVRATRGWDEAELERRERSQWPLEEKRRRSQFVIVNDSDPGALRARVAEVFSRIVGAGRAGSP